MPWRASSMRVRQRSCQDNLSLHWTKCQHPTTTFTVPPLLGLIVPRRHLQQPTPSSTHTFVAPRHARLSTNTRGKEREWDECESHPSDPYFVAQNAEAPKSTWSKNHSNCNSTKQCQLIMQKLVLESVWLANLVSVKCARKSAGPFPMFMTENHGLLQPSRHCCPQQQFLGPLAAFFPPTFIWFFINHLIRLDIALLLPLSLR